MAGADAVYVFERTPGTDEWIKTAVLRPSGAAIDFGRALAFDGRTAIVGAVGTAQLFRRRQDATWREIGSLVPPEPDTGFGRMVDVGGNTAIVGATSAAHVFSRDPASRAWSRAATLLPPSGRGTFLPGSLAIDGDTAVVTEGLQIETGVPA